jgi:hypothetical protein
VRATTSGKPVDPAGVEAYLKRAFGEQLPSSVTSGAAGCPPSAVQSRNGVSLFAGGFAVKSHRRALVVALLCLVAVAERVSSDPTGLAKPLSDQAETLQAQLLAAAIDYPTWGRVDDEMRWGPAMCRGPRPGLARVSHSTDATTHGEKLYSLFARKHFDYLAVAAGKSAPVGQVVVKQSWVPEEVTDPKELPGDIDQLTKVQRTSSPRVASTHEPESGDDDHFYPFARKGDKVFRAARQADLFIMMKLEPKTPGTDAGWVYATLTPDGKTVTSAGKIESCMGCHRAAKSDRLFGLRHE